MDQNHLLFPIIRAAVCSCVSDKNLRLADKISAMKTILRAPEQKLFEGNGVAGVDLGIGSGTEVPVESEGGRGRISFVRPIVAHRMQHSS